MSSSAVTLSYHTVNGSIGSVCAEGIGATSLLRDALGNVATTSSDTLPSETSRFYAAYGTQLGDTTEGSDYQFGWIGALGYRRQSLKHAEEYVRARTYGVSEARWTSVDPLWPDEPAYAYASENPINTVDPSGSIVQKKHEAFLKTTSTKSVDGVAGDVVLPSYCDVPINRGYIDMYLSFAGRSGTLIDCGVSFTCHPADNCIGWYLEVAPGPKAFSLNRPKCLSCSPGSRISIKLEVVKGHTFCSVGSQKVLLEKNAATRRA